MKRIINFGFIIFFLTFAPLFSQTPFSAAPVVLSADTVESQGVAWADYDDDGWTDLYISKGDETTGATAANLLFKNNSGVLVSQSMGSLTSLNDLSGSASWGDYDNDGFIDLYLAVAAPFNSKNNNLFLNDGAGGFIDKTSSGDVGDISTDPMDSGYVGWGDYNNDGMLDMFVDNGKVIGFPPYVFPAREVCSFYENNNGVFTKMDSAAIGPIVGISDDYQTFRSGFSWCDYNNDGFYDIFNGSGYGSRNKMWKNNNGTGFVEVFDFSEQLSSTRGVSWGDYDNDGDMDLFIGNIIDGDRGYNFLYENFSTPELDSLKEVVSGIGEVATDYHYTNGSVWGDFDNDGDLDLVVSNYGMPDSGSVSRYYQNSGYPDYNFSRVASEIDSLNPGDGSRPGFGRAVASADADKDGYLDLAFSRSGKPLLYMNQASGNNYLVVRLRGNGTTNKSAIGARVKVVATITAQGGKVKQMREISGQTGAGAQNSLPAFFGLGDAAVVDSLIVEWPASGDVERFSAVAVNQYLTITEDEPSAVGFSGSTLPGTFELYQNFPNPFNPVTTVRFNIERSGTVKLNLYDTNGREVVEIVNGYKEAGSHTVELNGATLASGIYFYRLTANGQSAAKRMLLVK